MGGKEPGGDPEERALATAVRTDDGDDLATLNREAEAVQRPDGAVALAQVLRDEHGAPQIGHGVGRQSGFA